MTDKNLTPSRTVKADKKKLLLGGLAFLLLLATVGTTLVLVKQRQELRKEAEISPGCFWEFDIACEYPAPPTIEILNQNQFENPVYFHWQAAGATCVDYQGSISGLHTYTNLTENTEEEKADQIVDGQENWVSGQVRSKSSLPPDTCESCQTANASCCPTEWVTQQICLFCKNPAGIQLAQVNCPDQGYDGTKITWNDQSNYEQGFNIYSVDQYPNPTVFNYIQRVDPDTEEYTDCDSPWGTYQYLVTCYTDTCGAGQTTPTWPPTATPTPTATASVTPPITVTPTVTPSVTPAITASPTATLTATPTTPTGTSSPTATGTRAPTATSSPTGTAAPTSTGTTAPTPTATSTPRLLATPTAPTGPTATPTTTSTATPTIARAIAQAPTSSPVPMPVTAFSLPTIGGILGALALIIGSLVLLL